MLNKTNHKTRLTQIQAKHTSNATNKNKKIEESDKITQSPFSSTPWKNLSFEQTLELVMKGKN